MNRKDKLLERFCKMPKDFTFDEIETVFRNKGFTINNKGARLALELNLLMWKKI